MDLDPLLWGLAAALAWWVGAAAAGVRTEILRFDSSEGGDGGYALVSFLHRLQDDPVHLGLRLRFSRYLSASVVPLGLAAAFAPLSWKWGAAAGALGWGLAAVADVTGGGASFRRISRARGGAGYVVWAKLTQPLARAARPLTGLRREREPGTGEQGLLFAESQVAALPEGARLGRDERRFLRRLLANATILTADIMTRWEAVDRLSAGDSLEEAAERLRASGHSRLPVMEGGRVAGMVWARDLVVARHRPDGRRGLAEVVRPAYFVSQRQTVDDLQDELRGAGVHLAVVLDRLGRPVGLVSMEDILDEIVGELSDARRSGAPRPGGGEA